MKLLQSKALNIILENGICQNVSGTEVKYYCLRSTLINSVRNKEELPEKVDKTDCNNYRGISLLLSSYKILSNILLSRLSPYIDEIIGDHQCGFRRNRSTTDQIFCIRQILEKKWEQNETLHQLFIDFKKTYDPVRREVLYNILIEFGVPMKLVRLIRMCLNETYSKVCIGKHLSDIFPSKML
jgi:hypothetical protein